MQGKTEDAGGLTPAKDDNAAMHTLYLQTSARNSDDCYSIPCSGEKFHRNFRTGSGRLSEGRRAALFRQVGRR